MGELGNIVNGAVGTLGDVAGIGSRTAIGQTGSTLDDFLTYFSSNSGEYVKKLDPMSTFDVKMTFYPTPDQTAAGNSYLSKLTDKALTQLTTSAKNALNNATGGLWSSLFGTFGSSIDQRRKSFAGEKGSNTTFMSYLASANLLVTDNMGGLFGASDAISPLELDLSLYTQSITIPAIRTAESTTDVAYVGSFPVNGFTCQPDSNQLQMNIVNTVVPLAERIFYPWLREVTLPYWTYTTQPYTTATVVVDMTKHSDTKYVFYGCRPTRINAMQAQQQNSGTNLTRDITLAFDYMFIFSEMQTTESVANKLISSAKTLVNGAANLLNA